MRLGVLLLNRFGFKKAYFRFFQKLFELGVMGMGYGELMKNDKQDKAIVKSFFASVKNKQNLIVFDVGANEGTFLNYFSDSQLKKVEYHAFEPNEKLHSSIQSHLKDKNSIELKLNKSGVGDKEEAVIFNISQKHVCSSLYKVNDINEHIKINIVRLDKYCSQNNIEYIDLLKIDTEGNDYAVLHGAEELIKNGQVNFIVFEFSELAILANKYFQDFWDLLSPTYQIFYVLKDGLIEITQYSSLYHEIFYPNNFIAKLRQK